MRTEEFKRAVGKFPTGVTVITTNHSNKLWGFTANSFVSVSLEPRLVSFCINKNSGSFHAFDQAELFAISILASDQAEISKHFAHAADDKFANIEYELTDNSKLPLITGAACHIECSKLKQFECGDHFIFVGEAMKVKTDEKKSSLVYFAKTYREIKYD